jgi:DNA-binding NtrC family response regulator
MESDYRHSILIIEGDPQTKKIITSILRNKKVDTVFSDTGESALKQVRERNQPFSLIISAQSLTGMPGTVFLENAKKHTPNSIRFLMARYSEMQTVINAVNLSAVQRFFVKPFKDEDFLAAVQSGLNRYSSFLEHEKLLELVKKQNSKLYELNCELMEAAKAHTKTIHDIDNDIAALEKAILADDSSQFKSSDELFNAIVKAVTVDKKIDAGKVEMIFLKAVQTLYDRFNDLALRHGFKMSEINEDLP